MVSSSAEPWKIVAWNGISFRAPPHWEIGALASSYLQLDDGLERMLELKWRQVKGRFSHQAHLHKLARYSDKESAIHFRQKPLLDGWRQALRGFEAEAFAWRGAEVEGEGTILFCPLCQTATLLQFSNKLSRGDPSVTLRVLESFRDHRNDGLVAWALFGLRALTPQRFNLIRHRFRPGHYELVFRHRQEWLNLIRWGPASFLLKGGDLRVWFEKRCKEFRWCNLSSIQSYDYGGRPALHGESCSSDSLAARLWARMSGRLPHWWIRIWHLRAQNQILAIEARGLGPLDEALLEEICSNYDMVSA